MNGCEVNIICSVLDSDDEHKGRIVIVEFDDLDAWSGDYNTSLKRIKANGFRTMAKSKTNPITATIQNHVNLYADGFDVAYTYNLTNAVEARKIVNQNSGIAPP